jgi:hypothetical protein
VAAEVVCDQGLVIVTLPKAILVLSRQTFIEGLQRGKQWKRRAAMAQRMADEDHARAYQSCIDYRAHQ